MTVITNAELRGAKYSSNAVTAFHAFLYSEGEYLYLLLLILLKFCFTFERLAFSGEADGNV